MRERLADFHDGVMTIQAVAAAAWPPDIESQ
jgi:hypothetical protein